VDPVTHTLVGVTVGNALFRRRAGRSAVPILALASNLPDLDAVVHLTGDPAAVLMRRTFGHALWLLPLWSAGLAWLLGRRCRHLKYGALFGMVLLGASIHILFDLINSFGVVLFWPFSPVRPELAMVFIIDFILTGLLALPLLLLLARPLRPHLERMSRVALVCVGLYLACCGVSRARAAGILEGAAAGAVPPDFSYVFPEPLGPHRWRGVVRRGTRYDIYLIRSFSGTVTLEETVSTETDDPAIGDFLQGARLEDGGGGGHRLRLALRNPGLEAPVRLQVQDSRLTGAPRIRTIPASRSSVAQW
jgi:membrane-bound metal-dependent hydrolase YbcI (DUF457 family)